MCDPIAATGATFPTPVRKVRNPFRPRVKVTDTWLRKQEDWFDSLVDLANESIRGGPGTRALLAAMLEAFLVGMRRMTTDMDAIQAAATAWLLDEAVKTVPRMQETTQAAVNAKLESAARRGLTPEQLQEELQDSFAFSRDRGLMISRTSGAQAVNVGEASGWKSNGILYVQIIDGQRPGTDEPCRHANGLTVEVDEFIRNPLAHPNCERRAKPLFDQFIPASRLGSFIDEQS